MTTNPAILTLKLNDYRVGQRGQKTGPLNVTIVAPNCIFAGLRHNFPQATFSCSQEKDTKGQDREELKRIGSFKLRPRKKKRKREADEKCETAKE